MRILSFDVGDRRIGVAVSDIFGWTAQGLDTIIRENHDEVYKRIEGLFKEYSPEKIVVGLPRNMNGSLGPQGKKVKRFANRLKKFFSGEIIYWDERLTSVQADKVMIDADLSRKKRKDNIDRMAAVFILQSYLDFERNKDILDQD